MTRLSTTACWTIPCRSKMGVALFAVVPILPTLQAFSIILSIVGLSLLGALTALRHPATAVAIWRLAWRQRVALLVLAAVAVAVAVGISSLTSVPSGASQAVAIDWPVARGGLARHGAAEEATGPTAGGILWSAGRRGDAFYASAAVTATRVYTVGSQGNRAAIYAIDLGTGRQLWRGRPKGYAATFSSPVVAGDLLVCGEGLHHTSMARVVCLNRDTGETLWTFRTNGHVECTPAIDAGRVYVGAGDDGVYCLKLDPAVRDDQRLVWHAPGSTYPDAETSLAVAGNRVYVGLGIGGEAICCLDASDGTELGRIELPFPVFSPPCIDGGKLYIGMGVGDYLTPMKDPAGQVCCIDLDRWEVEWSLPTPATVLGAIVAVDDQLLFGCGDGSVYAISRQGDMLRKWQSYAPIIGSPAVAAGRVYVVNQDGMLYGLNRRTLQPIWQCRLGPAGRYVSSPTIAGDSVIVGTEHDRLLRVGRAATGPTLPVWPGYLGGAGAGGSIAESAFPHQGHFRWSYLPSGDGHTAVVAPAALTNDCVLVPFSGARRGLGCLDLPSTRSDPPVARWFLPAAHDVVTSPAISGRTGFFVDGALGEKDRGLHAVDLESGSPLWQVPVDPACRGTLTVDEAGVLIQTAPKTLSSLAPDGQRMWSRQVGDIGFPVATTPAMIAVGVSDPDRLLILDRSTGQELLQVELQSQLITSTVISGRFVLLGSELGLEMRRVIDGGVVWGPLRECGTVATPLAVDDIRCCFVNDKSELVVIRLRDGRVLARVPGVNHAMPPLIATNGIIVQGETSLMFAEHENWASLTGWCADADLRLTSPAVHHRGSLYFGVEGAGLACFGGDAL